MDNKKVLLMILDGWGCGIEPKSDAIACAKTPFFDGLLKEYSHGTLTTFGSQVGLPEGQMGNSEVGHLNIGAGRVVYQELLRINNALKQGALEGNPKLQNAFRKAASLEQKIHFLGLLSDGGVHSHTDHLMGLVHLAEKLGCRRNYIHAFTDGRDVDPQSGLAYVEKLLKNLEGTSTQLATLTGRYFAMDRDHRWERIKVAYDALVKGEGKMSAHPLEAIKTSYANNTTDEFIQPIICAQAMPQGKIEAGDLVVFFNFRTDRPRQLTRVLSQESFPDYAMFPISVDFVTMTRYDETFKGIEVVFEKDDLAQTLGEVLSQAGKSQLRIAETEKYPHVTFFFNGGREEPFKGEDRIMVPSPKVPTYDLQPSMSAFEIKDQLIQYIKKNHPDFIALNFANTDMVGHTGDFAAAQKAAEAVDQCLAEIVPLALAWDYHILIIADHGNSDYMINADGSPNTAHTTNPVPIIYVNQRKQILDKQLGKLADIAPTVLSIMGLDIPEKMDGVSLVNL
jgi:2,3-bisphosphoglycerate-independent phosphoglycerate mutase